MGKLMNFNTYINSINESSKPSGFQKFLQNLERGGIRMQFNNSGELTTTGSTLALVGKFLTKISKVGQGISSDFGMDWIDKEKNSSYYSKNRQDNLDRWARKNLTKNKKYLDDEIEKVYQDFKRKGKARFGNNYDFTNLSKTATDDEKLWADYANSILKKYVDTRV